MQKIEWHLRWGPVLGVWMIAFFLSTSVGVAIAADAPVGAQDQVNFTEHVAPIVFKNCTSCHRPGEGAPFTLMNYRDVKKRGRIIQGVVADGYMPPWPPAAGWGHFQDERRLSDDQISLIDRWVEGGMVEGPPEKLPPLPTFPAGGWSLGEPDLVVTLPEAFEVPADGPDIYRLFVLPLKLPEDQFVTAVEIRPTARSVVHHALYFLDRTGAARKLDEAEPGQGFSRMSFPPSGSLGGWAVGATPRRLPMGLAYPLPKGSDLIVQVHFHPSGKLEREQTSFGLYFAKERPKKKLLGMQSPIAFGITTELGTRGIKPGEKDFTIRGEWEAPFDIDVVSVGGHAHYLGKTMKAVAELPDGSEVKLFAIDDWDFNWQGRYNYATPVRLPKGAIVRTTLVYDNSADNPRNPVNPPVHVSWGEGSSDEMGAIGLSFIAVNEADIAAYKGKSKFSGGNPANQPGGLRDALAGGGIRNMTPQQLTIIFKLLDADRDGKLAGTEVPDRLRLLLPRLDTNGDSALDFDELRAVIGRAGNGSGSPGQDAKPESEPKTKSDSKVEKPAVDSPVTDLEGKLWNPFKPAEGDKAQVLIFITGDCPVANQFSQEIGRLARQYADQSVPFLLVHVDPATTASVAREHAKDFGLDLPTLLDPTQRLAERAGAEVTPEAAVITPDGKVAYCGRIDDRFGKLGRQKPEASSHDLRDALDAVLAGRPVAQPRVKAIGCPIADLKS